MTLCFSNFGFKIKIVFNNYVSNCLCHVLITCTCHSCLDGEAQFYVLTDVDTDIFTTQRELLVSTKPLKPELDRSPVVSAILACKGSNLVAQGVNEFRFTTWCWAEHLQATAH